MLEPCQGSPDLRFNLGLAVHINVSGVVWRTGRSEKTKKAAYIAAFFECFRGSGH